MPYGRKDGFSVCRLNKSVHISVKWRVRDAKEQVVHIGINKASYLEKEGFRKVVRLWPRTNQSRTVRDNQKNIEK